MTPVYGIEAIETVSDRSVEVGNKKGNNDFSVHFHTSRLSGEAHEYLYWPNVGGHKASELIWKIDNIFMHGAGFSVKPVNWLAINTDGWFNIFKGIGTMDDYDWRVPGRGWTDWSHHKKTDVTRGSIMDINIELIAFDAGSISFSGLFGFKRDNWEWKAYGGSYIYSDNRRPDIFFRDDIFSLSDKILSITYEQTFNVPYVGINMNQNFNNCALKARLITSPFVYGEAVDHHHLRNFVTYANFSGESIIILDIAMAYKLTEPLVLQMALNHTKYAPIKTDLAWHDQDKNTVEILKDYAGAELETTMFSCSFVFSF